MSSAFSEHLPALDGVHKLAALAVPDDLAVAVQTGVGRGLSMAVAWLSYECFEKHQLRLKRFWPATASGASS